MQISELEAWPEAVRTPRAKAETFDPFCIFGVYHNEIKLLSVLRINYLLFTPPGIYDIGKN